MKDDLGSREKLIEVAGRLFSEKGIDGVSTRDIAGEAHVNISLISYYFQGKEGLYVAVIEDFALKAQMNLQKMMTGFDAEQMTKQSYLQGMRTLIEHMLKMKFGHPYMSALMTRELLSGLPLAKEVHEKLFATMADKVIGLMELAQKKKIVRKDVHMPTLFISMVLAIDSFFLASKCDTALIKRCYRIPDRSSDYIDQIIKIFIEGVLE